MGKATSTLKRNASETGSSQEFTRAPRATPPRTFVHKVEADGVRLFYRVAGNTTDPVVLLLHGFPASSFMFRELIPRLADEYRVIAPDLPGFGFTEVLPERQYSYTFDRLALTIDAFTQALKINRYAIYVFDYGAPTGFRLAMAHPERVTAIVSQNGKNDPFFLPAGALAFQKDLPNAQVQFLDTGHFAIERHVVEIAAAMKEFLFVRSQ